MNVFIKYHGKTVGPYGVGGFQSLNSTTRRKVKNLVVQAAQEDGSLPPSVISSEMQFVFENAQTHTYAPC